MFTGLVQAVGRLEAREARGGDARLRIAFGGLPAGDVALGESIAVNGVCLTVVDFDSAAFEADASNETLALTTLGRLPEGAPLNLERALRAEDRLGGHLVSGHVDGVGEVLAIEPDARAQRWRFAETAVGDAVNLEIDLVARYVERLLGARAAVDAAGGEGAQA